MSSIINHRTGLNFHFGGGVGGVAVAAKAITTTSFMICGEGEGLSRLCKRLTGDVGGGRILEDNDISNPYL